MTRDREASHRRMVHRRRRTLATLAILAIAGLAVAAVLLRPWEPLLAAAESAQQATTVAPTPTPTPTPSSSQPFTPIGGDPDAADGESCTSEQVELTPITDAETYAGDEDVELSFRIENVSDAACTLNVGTTQQRYAVRTGDEVVYRSDDCPVDEVDQVVSLQPGEPQETVPVVWDRTASSAATCAAPRRDVVAGGASYHLTVTVAGITSESSRQFILNG